MNTFHKASILQSITDQLTHADYLTPRQMEMIRLCRQPRRKYWWFGSLVTRMHEEALEFFSGHMEFDFEYIWRDTRVVRLKKLQAMLQQAVGDTCVLTEEQFEDIVGSW